MRVVWKDSSCRQKGSRKYRGIEIVGFENGWKIGLPDDDNVYKTLICCKNAIDKAMGGSSKFGGDPDKRKTHIIIRVKGVWVNIQE